MVEESDWKTEEISREPERHCGQTTHKVAVVTGASRGIGEGIARVLAAEGYHLALCCEKNGSLLDALADGLLKAYGTAVLTAVGDVADPAFARQLKSMVDERFGHTDVLVNNAGISHIGLLCDMSEEEWERVISVNLSSCFYMARAFVPDMVRRQSGHLIQISSIWGSRGASCEVAYSAAKGGMEAFTKALAKELAPSHVAVNAISCGVIDTEMNAVFSEEERQALVEEIPMDRFGTPEEVGRCVAALLSMPYVTGQVLGVDGGY